MGGDDRNVNHFVFIRADYKRVPIKGVSGFLGGPEKWNTVYKYFYGPIIRPALLKLF